VTTHTAEDKLLLLRIDKKGGKVAWTQEAGSGTAEREGPKRQPRKVHKFYSPASPSPATDGKVVVVHFGNGLLAAYDFEGQPLWKHDLQEEYGAYTSWYGHANSPVVAGDVLSSANTHTETSASAPAIRTADALLIGVLRSRRYAKKQGPKPLPLRIIRNGLLTG
jgi:hypothetical protein